MSVPMDRRLVSAPADDWLSKEQVTEVLRISKSTLDRMIAAGQFPRAVEWPGEDRARWRWVDVAWYLLGREVSDRLAVAQDASPGVTGHSPGTK